MGYTTDFTGDFTLDNPLTPEQIAYLKAFNETRRMQRNATVTETMPDPVRLAVGLPIGKQGGYFVGHAGRDRTPDVTEYNESPSGQPGLWCQWTPNNDGTVIEWDGGEKFYDYIEWIQYIIQHFLTPWGHVLNGTVEWSGEESGDLGRIEITNNVVKVKTGKVIYE